MYTFASYAYNTINLFTMPQRIHRSSVIQALKQKFFGNDPASWGNHSNKTLLDWYKEYIICDMKAEIEII